VYGLGADARLGQAVAGIFAAKNRPSFNPLIIHVSNSIAAARYAKLNKAATLLADAFWPGPLTLVLPLRPEDGLSDLVTAGLSSVGIRVPAHPVAQALLARFDGPIAAPSANPSGRISPTSLAHVMNGLDGRIDAVVDGGPCDVGLESTIVGFPDGMATLLRPGGLSLEEIEDTLHQSLATWHPNAAINAPGQLQSHYAPVASVRLNAQSPSKGEVYLGFADKDGDENLSPRGDLGEAAARLFALLHKLDRTGKPISVAPIPDHGLGRAINDRLRRAAAPKPDGSAAGAALTSRVPGASG